MQKSAGIFQTVSRHPLATPATSRKRPRKNASTLLLGSAPILTMLTALPALITHPSSVLAQESCQVQESSLRDAINSYARSCNLPRVDCDPFDGEWICASFNMVGRVPPQTSSSNAATATTPQGTTTSPVVPTPDSPAQCEFSAPTLNAARIGYANSCSLPRVDCDPLGTQWTCASYQLGGATPANRNSESATSNPNDTGLASSNPNDTGFTYSGDFGPPQRAWSDSYSANGRCYIASSFDHGIGDVLVNTPAGSRTVRQVADALGSGPGVGNNPIYNDVQCGNGPANNAGDEDINQCPGRVDQGAAGCSVRGPSWDLSVFEPQTAPVAQAPVPAPTVTPATSDNSSPISGPVNAKSSLPNDSRYEPGDLIGMHHDNSGDRDDGHATAANRMVVSYFGLGEALHIVNGTLNARFFPHGYDANSEIVMNAAWGSEGSNASWWNSIARPDLVRNATAARWRETLEAGHKVWLAEGGPSDFTAGVLRQLESTTDLNLKNIHIVQHSVYNEDHTNPTNFSDVQRLATYHKIGDGNTGGNNTADLNQANDAVARRFLSDVEFGDLWRAAFEYLPVFNCDRSGPHCKFDGSDAVAMMWIVGIESDEIRGWSDFASRFAN